MVDGKPLHESETLLFMEEASFNLSISISEVLDSLGVVPWNYLEVARRSDITIKAVEKLVPPYPDGFWEMLSSNLALKDIENHPEWPWVYGKEENIKYYGQGISWNSGVNLPFIINHPDKDWDWLVLFCKDKITIEDAKTLISKGILPRLDKSKLINSPYMTPEHALELRAFFDPRELINWVNRSYGVSIVSGSCLMMRRVKTIPYDTAVSLLRKFSEMRPVVRTVKSIKVYDLPFDYVMETQKSIPWDLKYHWSRPDIGFKYIDTLDPTHKNIWEILSANLAISFQYIKSHPEYKWDTRFLATRSDLSVSDIDYIIKIAGKNSEVSTLLSANPVVTTEYIYNNSDTVEWNWKYQVSANPGLNIGFVLLFADRLDFGEKGLSGNKFLGNSFIHERSVEMARQKVKEVLFSETHVPEMGVLPLIQSYVS